MSRLLKLVVCLLTIALSSFPSIAVAQATRDGRVQVSVVDPSGAVVPDATVNLVGLESATQAATLPPVKSNDEGIAIIERVPPGRYSVRAEFPGFELGLLRDIRVRAGDSRHVVILPLAKFEDTVTVGRDVQEAAADRRTTEFGLNLSKEQIDALSDDPTELQRQIAELAGPDAIVRVDSFEGQQLPPRAQIKSIHVTRDQFAAEAANPGSTFVDIITQPGVGALRGTLNFSFRDGSMSGRSQFTPTRGPEQVKDVNGTIGGTIVQNKTGFSLSMNSQNQFVTPILNARLPEGQRAETLSLRQPLTGFNLNSLIDHSITRDQVLRVSFNTRRNTRQNQGIGDYNLPDRAFSQKQNESTLRIQEAGPIGRRSFINTRLSYNWLDLDMHSAVEKPAIVVQDAFTSGGAQNEQVAHVQQVVLASDIDYVRGIHSWRGGVELQGNWFTASSSFNYLGTYTFSSLDAYQRGEPILYTRSLGTPEVNYHNLQGAVYFQDDIRVRRGLTFSPGIRYSLQERVNDSAGIAPRFGFTWAPSAAGRTTLRGSAGIFHSWLPLQMIEQTLRLNGELQREIIIRHPSYPDPGDVSALTLPTSKYMIGRDFKLGRNVRYSGGVDQVLSPRVRMNVLYNYIHLQQQPRGRNVNAPVNGVRPDPNFANVIESVTDTQIRRHEVFINSIINFVTPSPAVNQARFNWRRVNINAGYSFIRARNNAAGWFDVSPSGNPENDWGPGPADQPYRIQLLVTSTQIRNVTVNATYLANAGQPYNWTTGFDDNGDGLLNDRPEGVGLRSLRMSGMQSLNMRVAYALQLGEPAAGGGAPPGQGRYRVNIFANVQNLTNHQNLGGYSGVQTSPFFREPRTALNPRRVDIGLGLNF